MPPEAAGLLVNHPPLIIAGITAAGKNTLAAQVMKKTKYRHIPTHTTRRIRPGEVHGVDRWFVDEEEMLRLLRSQAFIEAKLIHGETVYASSIEAYQDVLAAGNQPMMDLDVQGIEEVSSRAPNFRPFFVIPPDYDEWMGRLHGRGAISEEDKNNRIESARKELATVLNDPNFVVLVNRQVDETVEEILSGRIDKAAQLENRALAKKLLDQLEG